jgi:tetratricopeptide (TPR) repeat protein
MPYRDTDKSLPEIARELAVTTVLEGAVQRAGDQVRITVQLIDAPADKHLWAETYDRELTTDSLFAIQSEVTSRIAESLKARLTPSENSRLHDHPTNSLAAYNHYMRGRLLMPSRVTEDLRQAVTEFEQALAADPEYAKAWVQLAICADLLKYQGHAIPRYSNILEEAAHKVLALNDQLGEGYLLLAFTYDWNQADETKMAEAAFQRAVELSPNNAGILKEYAQFLDRAGRWGTDWKLLERSLDLMLRAAELDPLSPVIQILVGSSYLQLGREDEGIEIIERVIQLDPDMAWTYYTIGLHYSWSGRLAEALGWYRQAEQRDAENIFMIYPQANVFRMIGDYKITAEYRDHIAERFPGRDTSWLNLAIDLDGSSWQEALQSDDSATAPLINTWLYLIGEDYQSAYESFLKWRPYWGDPEQWPHLIRTDDMYHGACFAAGIFISAGQEGGWELLALAREYLEVNYAKTEKKWFPWFWNLGLCYLLDGSHEDALDFWEEYVARGHWSFPVWFLVHRLPWWEPLREHPRYIELMNRVEQSKSEQRKLIRKMGVMIPEIPMEID